MFPSVVASRATAGGQGRTRTSDTPVFSRVLYHLSYLADLARATGFDPATFTLTG